MSLYEERLFFLLIARDSYRTARILAARGESFKASSYRIRAANAVNWSRKCKAAAAGKRV